VILQSSLAEKLKIYYPTTTCSLMMFRKAYFKYSTLYFVEDDQIADSPYLVLNSIPENTRPKKLALLAEEGADEKTRNVELARGEQALVSLRLIQRPTSNFE
jgi:hypothetical protein